MKKWEQLILWALVLFFFITVLKHLGDTGWGRHPSADLLDWLRP